MLDGTKPIPSLDVVDKVEIIGDTSTLILMAEKEQIDPLNPTTTTTTTLKQDVTKDPSLFLPGQELAPLRQYFLKKPRVLTFGMKMIINILISLVLGGR